MAGNPLEDLDDESSQSAQKFIEEYLQWSYDGLSKYPEGSRDRRFLDGLLSAATNLSKLVRKDVLENTMLNPDQRSHIRCALRTEAFELNSDYDGDPLSIPFFIKSSALLAIAAYLNSLEPSQNTRNVEDDKGIAPKIDINRIIGQ